MFHNCTKEQLLFWLKGTVGTQFGTPAPRKASTTLLVTRYFARDKIQRVLCIVACQPFRSRIETAEVTRASHLG